MIIRRLILGLAAATAFSAAAATCVVALAFALFALVEPYVGRAGAAGIVAASAMFLLIVVALAVSLMARPKRRTSTAGAPAKALDRAFNFVRQKPVVAITTAVAAGFLAVRNPRYLGTAVRAFMEGRDLPKR
ncbi:MAG TPA: hypothetical protein VII73_01425 [Caulobacteraceae bacterium]